MNTILQKLTKQFQVSKNALLLMSSMIILLCLPKVVHAAKQEKIKKVVGGIGYYKNFFGHLHQNPSRYSQTFTTIACGHPLKIIKKIGKDGKEIIEGSSWTYVKVGGYFGYVLANAVSKTKIECFQDRYPKFFDQFDLEIMDLYYWGRLYDYYAEGKSRVK